MTRRNKKKKIRRERYRNTEFLVSLGAKIRRVRQAKGFSIDKLHLETPHISRATISRIEKGVSDPQASTLKRIAETLGVELHDLIRM